MHLLLVFCAFVFVDGRTKFSKRSRNVERHRHSTRVVLDKPSSILLPPFEDLFVINVPEASKISLQDVIPPPFNYLVPPYFDHDELKNYTFNDTAEQSRFTFNLSDFAFFLSDLFDLNSTDTTISDILTNFTTVSDTSIDFTTVPTNPTVSTINEPTTNSATIFDISEAESIQPTESNEVSYDNKILVAQESGDFRNKVLAEKNYDYGDYNYESEYTPPPSRKVFEKGRNTTKICENRSGYVADVANGCQSFFICTPQGAMTPMSCPNGTLFSQDFLVCDWWYNVECV